MPELLLDRLQFDTLRAQLAPAVFATLVQSFAEAFPVQIHQLRVCATAGDLSGSALAAHQLRGFAINFGGQQMASVATDIGRACHIADVAALGDLVTELDQISKETWAQILSAMQRPQTAFLDVEMARRRSV